MLSKIKKTRVNILIMLEHTCGSQTNTTMSTTHSALIDIANRRFNRSPKMASKTDMQVADELFTGHQAARVDFTADYDSPECCRDRICQTCGIDHDFRPDFRTR
jgi:hypothetical protein